jgi:protein-S-isoprenylcysteine O-methyltransferase Ste14
VLWSHVEGGDCGQGLAQSAGCQGGLVGGHVSRLELKVPPDAVWLVVAALMWAASATTPGLAIPTPLRIGVAAPLVGAGIAVIAGARTMLSRARTTWLPAEPGRTTSLVTGGVYRLSRNPIYLGMLLALLAWAVVLASPLAVALSAAFVLYMDRFQIGPEERALLGVIGDEYRDYTRRVRRWL